MMILMFVLFSDCNPSFLPILNPGIGGVAMPGFWDYIKIVEILLLLVLDDKITILAV